MNYCINPRCRGRENPNDLERCLSCGAALLINGKYRLVEPLRSLDSFSPTDVFEVVDERGTHKVMKVLKSDNPKLVELFERESLILQLLTNSGIPECDLEDGFFPWSPDDYLELHCLVIAKIEGQNLEQWMESNKHISQSLALNWLQQIVEILDCIHRAGFFHRDIKPSNIMVKPDGQLVLIDFGCCRDVSNTYLSKVSSGLNRTGNPLLDATIVKTAGYSPLEQINGKAVPQSDFYSLGRTLVYLLTGTSPINLPDDRRTGKMAWRQRAKQVDEPLADLIDSLMAPFPGLRPQNTQIILQRLKGLPIRSNLNRLTKRLCSPPVIVCLALLGIVTSSWAISNIFFYLAGRNQDRPEVAKKYYQLAATFNPIDADAYQNLALACQEVGDKSCTEASLKALEEIAPNSWKTHYVIGNFYDDMDKLPEAKQEYSRAISLNSKLTINAVINLGRLENRTGNYNAAFKLSWQNLQLALTKDSRAALLKNIGWAEFEQGKALAQDNIQGKVQLLKSWGWDKFEPDLRSLAGANVNQQQHILYTAAKKHLNQALRDDPTRPDTYCLLGKVEAELSDNATSKNDWVVCLSMNSNLPEVRDWKYAKLVDLWKIEKRISPQK